MREIGTPRVRAKHQCGMLLNLTRNIYWRPESLQWAAASAARCTDARSSSGGCGMVRHEDIASSLEVLLSALRQDVHRVAGPGTAINRGQRPTTWSGAADFRACERVSSIPARGCFVLRRNDVTRARKAW